MSDARTTFSPAALFGTDVRDALVEFGGVGILTGWIGVVENVQCWEVLPYQTSLVFWATGNEWSK